jgi:chromosome segregation ATPase
MDAAPPFAAWDAVKEVLARLKEDSQRFEVFCSEQLDELEAQREAIEAKKRELEQQRAALSPELDEARSQLARLASVAVDLADARSELVKTKSELLEQREAAAEASRRATTLEKQVSQLRRENAALETDLAESRHRAETEKRRLSEQRAEWVGELLRSALDLQAQTRDTEADLKVVHDDTDALAAEALAAKAASSARVDPVLGAVMQQFEALQKGRDRGKVGRQDVA